MSDDAAPASASPEPPSTTLDGPPTGLVPPTPEERQLVGTVIEHLSAGGYHYLKVAPEQGSPRWVVTLGGTFDEGGRVVVEGFGSRHDFYSRRLDRRFDDLLFGVVDVAG